MPAPQKLTDVDVKLIRRRLRRGERITDLATEFGVNHKTIRRRLDALEQAEAQEQRRKAAKRLRRQAGRAAQARGAGADACYARSGQAAPTGASA